MGRIPGDSQALVTMRLENGVRALYEGAKTNAVGLNGWSREYLRAECELATLIMDHHRELPYGRPSRRAGVPCRGAGPGGGGAA